MVLGHPEGSSGLALFALFLLAEGRIAEMKPRFILVPKGGRPRQNLPEFVNNSQGHRDKQRYKRKVSFVHALLHSIKSAKVSDLDGFTG